MFADGVLAEEDPTKWITPTPSIGVLNGNTELRKQVVRIANALRQVYHRLLVADLISSDARELALSIQGHLEKAAGDIQSGQHGAAVWELHLSIEKALKVFLRQTGESIPQSHDLTKLVADAEQVGLPLCSQLNLQQLPHHSDAIKHRYAELAAPTFERIMEIYDIALHVTVHIAGAFKQSAFANHKEFYIKALSWHPKWKQGQQEKNNE